jgi:DNA polymerase III subunit gamma/tau
MAKKFRSLLEQDLTQIEFNSNLVCQNWQELNTSTNNCQACELHQERTQVEFAQVVGQQVAVAIAQASLLQTPLQTTFLLVGASGSGKTTLARIMARSLNCKEKAGVEPCNCCASCLSHLKDNHLAISEINGADQNGVDDVRGIIERCQVNTLDSKYRIFIMDECHQMSKPAQNAMLKLLEDPRQDTIFILCTTEEDKLLETIRSRARILRFQTVPRDLVTGYMLNIAHHGLCIATEQFGVQPTYVQNRTRCKVM